MAAAISRASMRCQLSSPCRPSSTTSSPGRTSAEIGHVDGQHIHRDGADNRDAPASNQHVTASTQPSVESIGVACRNDGNRSRLARLIPPAVANTLARSQSFDCDDATRQRHHRNEIDRRRQRRRHDPIQQQPWSHRVEPDARITKQRGAVARVTKHSGFGIRASGFADSRSQFLNDSSTPSSKRSRCVLKTGLSGTSADAKCV